MAGAGDGFATLEEKGTATCDVVLGIGENVEGGWARVG